MRAEELLQTLTDDELQKKANACFIQAENTNVQLANGAQERQRLLTEADFYLKALTWRQSERTAERDRARNEEIAERDHKLEVWVLRLIGIEILLSVIGLWAGYQQGKVMDKQTAALTHMDASTTDTAALLKTLTDAQAKSLGILQEEQIERGKKPRLVLYVGSLQLGKTTLHTTARSGLAQTTASLDLILKNEGDAPVSTFRLQALVPRGVGLDTDQLITVPESEPTADANTYKVTLQLAPLSARETRRLHIDVYVPKGRSPFKISFTVDALELQAVGHLGALKVIPPNP
jgi:hypothetical protein